MTKPHLIEGLIREEKWKAARKAIEAALKTEPDDHWLMTRLSLTYYEEHDYETSLKYVERARDLAPKCPLVLWDLAGTLQMLDRHDEALALFRQLVRRGPKRIAAGPCGEGLARARGLVADCHYRISQSLRAVGSREESLAEFRMHLDMRGPGCRSIYRIGDLNKPGTARSIRRPLA